MTTSPTTSTVTPLVQRWRIALVAGGVVIGLVGLVTLLNDVPFARYPTIALWLAGALVVHDGIVAMSVFAVSVLLRRVRIPQVPFAALLVVQGAVVVGLVVTAVVVPEIIKKAIGTAHPSVLPLDYAINLLVFHAALGVVAAVGVSVALVISRRRGGSRTL